MSQRNILTVLLLLFLVSLIFLSTTALAVTNKIDYFGYYFPKKEFRVGKFTLDHLDIAFAGEVKSYQTCTLRNKSLVKTFAPVMFQFSDPSSGTVPGPDGQESYANTPRVLPETCSITRNTITFTGKDKQIGTITFIGTIDLKALEKIRREENSQDDPTVIKGNLTIAGKTYKNIEFGWFGGD